MKCGHEQSGKTTSPPVNMSAHSPLVYGLPSATRPNHSHNSANMQRPTWQRVASILDINGQSAGAAGGTLCLQTP